MEKHGYNKAVRKIQQQGCGKEVIMSQKQVAGWLKGITLSIAGMGLLFFGLVVPYLAWDMAVTYPDYAALRVPGILYGWKAPQPDSARIRTKAGKTRVWRTPRKSPPPEAACFQ